MAYWFELLNHIVLLASFSCLIQGAKCYSREFLAYDIICDTWSSLDHTIPSILSADLDR